MKKRMFRKGDILLIIGCLVLALGALLMLRLQRQEGAQVSVYVDGEWVSSYPLGEDRTVLLTTPDGSSYNTLVIKNGRADIIDAGCPDKLCVNMHSVAYAGETITCLPNKTVIKIEGGAPGGVDVY
jgi:hypothetical protein